MRRRETGRAPYPSTRVLHHLLTGSYQYLPICWEHAGSETFEPETLREVCCFGEVCGVRSKAFELVLLIAQRQKLHPSLALHA